LILSEQETTSVLVGKEAKDLCPPLAGESGIPTVAPMHVTEISGSRGVDFISHEPRDFIAMQNSRGFKERVDVCFRNSYIVLVIKEQIVGVNVFSENLFVRERKCPWIFGRETHLHLNIGREVLRGVGENHDVGTMAGHAPEFPKHFLKIFVIGSSVIRNYSQDLHKILTLFRG
jgi:hypothetical protein